MGETGQPSMLSNRARWLGKSLSGHLCTNYRYTQIRKGIQERGNLQTTCAVKSGRWLEKSLSDN
ncbi:hypothetical protein GBA52_014940 [Prunus armeniaca]|nr:hypothetical protein GBA52_014940 [Prunus armeniaca]